MYEDINTQHYFTSARIMADHALILTIKPDITIRVLQFCLKHAIWAISNKLSWLCDGNSDRVLGQLMSWYNSVIFHRSIHDGCVPDEMMVGWQQPLRQGSRNNVFSQILLINKHKFSHSTFLQQQRQVSYLSIFVSNIEWHLGVTLVLNSALHHALNSATAPTNAKPCWRPSQLKILEHSLLFPFIYHGHNFFRKTSKHSILFFWQFFISPGWVL